MRRAITELRDAGFSVVHERKRVGLMFLGNTTPVYRQFVNWSAGLGRVSR